MIDNDNREIEITDPYFRVEVLSKTERPNLLSYLAMHQCCTETTILDEIEKISQLTESELGRRIVKNCLKFGHYSIIEHPTISFCVSGFPHSVMVQASRHRHLSFSVQSQRYTGERIVKLAQLLHSKSKDNKFDKDIIDEVNKIFYLRPLGTYRDRQGNNYEYNTQKQALDLNSSIRGCLDYLEKIEQGYAPEHARDFLPQNIRQDFVVTLNARSLLHFCDLRLPKDAQLEIRVLAQLFFLHFKQWMPECAKYYEETRYGKNKLSP